MLADLSEVVDVGAGATAVISSRRARVIAEFPLKAAPVASNCRRRRASGRNDVVGDGGDLGEVWRLVDEASVFT